MHVLAGHGRQIDIAGQLPFAHAKADRMQGDPAARRIEGDSSVVQRHVSAQDVRTVIMQVNIRPIEPRHADRRGRQ